MPASVESEGLGERQPSSRLTIDLSHGREQLGDHGCRTWRHLDRELEVTPKQAELGRGAK